MSFERASNSPESVKEAAISIGGVVFTGRMHFEAYDKARAEMPLMVEKFADKIIDGYVTSTGRFVTRDEAGKIAESSGQLEHLDDEYKTSAVRKLDSHDLPTSKKLVEDWGDEP